MEREEFYNNIWKKAYINAFTIVKNASDAEDIAQITTIKFYLKKASIENPLSWIAVVAKNEAITVIKKKNKLLSLKDENISDGKSETVDIARFWDNDNDLPEDLTVTKNEVKKLLSKKDYKTFILWNRSNFNTAEMAHNNKLSLKQASDAIYKMRRNLRATILLNADYKGTKKIINYQLNKKIIYFIKKFTEKMKENNLKSLHKYFVLYKKPIPQLDIHKYYDYEIFKPEKNTFRITIPYKNSKERISLFWFIIIVDKKNNIRVTKFFEKPTKIYHITLSKEELSKKILPLKKGVNQETAKELEKKLKGHLVKYDDEEILD